MQNLVITDAGRELIAQMLAERTAVTFTRICTSDWDYSTEDLKSLTGMQEIRQEVPISQIVKQDSARVEVMGAVDNRQLAEGYYIRAVGLYAKGEAGEELLYAVSISEHPDYMPAFGGSTLSGVTFRLLTRVGQTDQVITDINPGVYVSVGQFQEHIAAAVQTETGVHGLRYFNGQLEVQGADGSWRCVMGESLTESVSLIQGEVNQLQARVDRLEDMMINDVTKNPYLITFESLTGIVAEGVWNAGQRRIEF